jgi:hypothetical protein
MKVKWLIILSVVFVGILLISLFIALQNNTTLLQEERNLRNKQLAGNLQLPPSINAMPLPAPLTKRGITIIKSSTKEEQNKVPLALPEKSIEVISVSSEEISTDTVTPANAQVGITKIGKHPSPKEAKEMNSAGIVMY